MSQSQLLAAANKEGTVTWYPDVPTDALHDLTAAFEKAYPKIKLETLRATTDQIVARISTEARAGKVHADVVTGTSNYLYELQQSKLLQAYDAKDAPKVPAGVDIPAGLRNILYVYSQNLIWNPDTLKKLHIPTPTSFEDLTKPIWKGHFGVHASIPNLYTSLIAQLGHAKALALFKNIGNNDPKLFSSSSLAVTSVAAGSPAATIGINTFAASQIEKGANLKFGNFTPLPTVISLESMVKGAPHPAAAAVLLNWMESRHGQQQIVKTTDHISLRTDVTDNDLTCWDPTKWKPIYTSPTIPANTFNQYVTEYKQAIHSTG